jgi:hypothetical protein
MRVALAPLFKIRLFLWRTLLFFRGTFPWLICLLGSGLVGSVAWVGIFAHVALQRFINGKAPPDGRKASEAPHAAMSAKALSINANDRATFPAVGVGRGNAVGALTD